MNSLNLTKIESEIFEKILSSGSVKPGKIVKELGLHKSTVYSSLRRLEEKGLIEVTNPSELFLTIWTENSSSTLNNYLFECLINFG